MPGCWTSAVRRVAPRQRSLKLLAVFWNTPRLVDRISTQRKTNVQAVSVQKPGIAV